MWTISYQLAGVPEKFLLDLRFNWVQGPFSPLFSWKTDFLLHKQPRAIAWRSMSLSVASGILCIQKWRLWSDSLSIPRENGTMAKDTIMGTKYQSGKIQPLAWCCVKRACVRIRLWQVRRNDSSRVLDCGVLIDAGGTWALWLARACRLLACERAAIDF